MTTTTSATAPSPGPAPVPSPAILAVNDREDQLIATVAVLEPVGVRVVTASTGAEALRLLLREDFAAILLDVNMPGMDGFEFAAATRSRDRSAQTPIIFLTASSDNDLDRLRGYELGAFDFLRVPVDPVILRAKVSAFVRLHQLLVQTRHQADELAVLNRHLADQARQLDLMNQELEAFSYSVSHDLRAPLRAINQFGQMLGNGHDHQLDADGRHLVERIRANGVRMGQLIDDLLALSRVSRVAVGFALVDLSALAGEVLDTLRQRDPERVVELAIAPGMTTRGDAGLLRLLLDNLLGNAWKYTSRRPLARIAMGQSLDPGHGTAFWIRDNGAGFDMAYADKLFAPFQRLHHSDEFPGNGIGLSIAARVVQRHGGWIRADGMLDQGATITFTLATG